MRLTIVQVSDCHFRVGESKARELVQPLLSAVSARASSLGTLVFAVTGDIAFSGDPSEYIIAKEILSGIHSGLETIAGAQVRSLLVPGNHDCNFRVDSAARKAVLKSIGSASDWDPSIPETSTRIQRDFFEFASSMPRSALTFTPTSLIENWQTQLGQRAVRFWGINSAWMSQNPEQGGLWFPIHLLQEQIENAGPALNVLLLHHPFAWFQTEIRRSFHMMGDNSFDLVLAGHEHLPQAWLRDDLEGSKTMIIEGGVLQEQSQQTKGSCFNLVTLDLETSTATSAAYEFNGSQYIERDQRTAKIADTARVTKPHRRLSEKFLSYLRSAGATFHHPNKSGPLDLQDIFVEPDLVDIDEASDLNTAVERHINTRDVLSDLDNETYLVVGGAEKSGKSAWLRWMYMRLHDLGLTPVHIEGAAIKSPDVERVMKLIEKKYLEEYATPESTTWTRLDFRLRALLIDDIDDSRLNRDARKELLSQLTMQFGIVLVTCDDAIISEVIHDESEFDGFRRLQLPEMGHRIRDLLIGKWIRIGREATLSHAAFQVLREQRARAVNLLLGQNFLPSRPIFLLTILQSMELGAEASIRGSSLGEYYEYLIRHALLGVRVESNDLDAVLNYLTELGFFFVEGNRPYIASAEIAAFNANFAKRYAIPLKFEALQKRLHDADVLETWGDHVRFKYRYVLLFFAARYLARHFNQNKEVERLVRALGRNLTNAKYANLMLFVVHHSPDPAVLDILLEESEKAFKEVAPMRMDQEDLATINELVREIPRLAITDESTEARRERTLRHRDARAARKLRRRDDEGEILLAELKEDALAENLDNSQRVAHGLRLIAILGQVLRNHYGSLLAARKEQIAENAYALVGRMLRFNLDLVFKDRQGLVAYVAEELEKRGVQTQEKATSLANRFVFGFGSWIVFMVVKRAAESLGSDKLLPTHQAVAGTVDTPLSRLLRLAITLDYPATGPNGDPRPVPLDEFERFDKELNNNPCAVSVLRRLVRDYLYMFDVSRQDKHRICELLSISVRKQVQIQFMSTRKRKRKS